MKRLFLIIASTMFCQNVLGQKLDRVDYDIWIVQQGNKYVILNDDFQLPFEFDSLCKPYSLDDCILAKKQKWGLVDYTGKCIIPFEYDALIPTNYQVQEKDVFIARKDGKFGTININNNVIVPIKYDAITNWLEYGPEAHYISTNSKIGLIDRTGKDILPPVYDSIYYYNDDIIKVKKNDKYGIVTYRNETVIPILYNELIVDYDYWDTENEDMLAVKKDRIWQYLDTHGKIIKNNVPEIEITYKYEDFKLNNYDFEYIRRHLKIVSSVMQSKY